MRSWRSPTDSVSSPPVPARDAKDEEAWALYWSSWSLGGVSITLIGIMIVLFPQNAGRYVLQVVAIVLFCAIALLLTHSGHVTAASRWIVGALWAFLGVAAWTSGGLGASAITGYLVAVALSGLLLGVHASLLTAAASMVAYVVLAYAQVADLLPVSELTHSPLSRAVDLITFTAILAVTQALMLISLHRSRQRTERELAERKATEQRLEDLVDSAPFGAIAFELAENGELTITGTNKPAQAILGSDEQTLIDSTIDQVLPAIDTTDVAENLQRVARGGVVYEIDSIHYSDDRLSGDFELHAFQTSNNHVAVFFRDVTERMRAAQALQEKTDEIDRFFSLTVDLLLIADLDGCIIRVNDEWERSLGYSCEELEGTRLADLLHPSDIERTGEAMKALIRGEIVTGFVNRYRHKTGEFRWLEWRAATYDDSILYAAARDITDRVASDEQILALNRDLEKRVRERTVELEIAVAELEEATRAKSEFLASMSHELRTPLNSVIGFSGVLESGLAGPLNEEQERQVHMIRASGSRLLGLVNQVLDLSKMEADEVELTFSELDVSDVARHALDVVSIMARAKSLRLTSEIPTEPVMMVSDNTRIDQVLLNLLGNAVKFTDVGSVVLRVVPEDGHIRFEVEDTGPGIGKDELPFIFDRFYQVPPVHGGKHEGSGLGLAVTRQLVEGLGGRIEVESHMGEGSLFRVTLPRRPDAEESSESATL